jgi:NMD protein affecting ribosome stability and mRNA decay
MKCNAKQSKGLIRSLNRSGLKDDKSPLAAHKIALHEPTICARCGAVFLRKTWRHSHILSDEQLERRQWGFCPACQQVSQCEGQGRLLIKGSDLGDGKAVEQRIHNVAEHPAATQPERRVVSVDALDNGLDVLTTSQKLAHRLAHELKKAFGGRVTYTWSDDGTLLAEWDRDRADTSSRRKLGRSRYAH